MFFEDDPKSRLLKEAEDPNPSGPREIEVACSYDGIVISFKRCKGSYVKWDGTFASEDLRLFMFVLSLDEAKQLRDLLDGAVK